MAMVGTFVPHYDVYGHQHHKVPFKDKGVFGVQKPLWVHEAKFKTRSDLIQHRRAEKIPHVSYDIDGDNYVGDNDYFIARHFDKSGKQRLTKEERAECEEALGNGFRNRFIMGLEKHGISPYAIQQRRGKIVTQDTSFELGETYPLHFNARVVPKHGSQTEMKRDRLLERQEAAKGLKKAWDQKHPTKVEYEVPVMDRYEDPGFSSAKQMAQAESEEQRIKSGLYPIFTHVNPDRENMKPGLHYVQKPEFPTRSHLLAHRKEMLVQDLDASRVEGEETAVPQSVRRNEREGNAFEFRKCPSDAMTKTRIDRHRRCEHVEYNRTHFAEQMKQLPRYSDQPQPFWTMERCSSAPSTLAPNHIRARKKSLEHCESTPFPLEPPPANVPERPNTVGADVLRERTTYETSEKTVKRWTTLKIEAGDQRDGPRLFDSLTPTKTTAADYLPAELHSSFEFVRKNHQRNRARTIRGEGPTSKLPDHMDTRLRRSQSATRTATFSRPGETCRPRRPATSAPSSRALQKSRFQSGPASGTIQTVAQRPPAKMADTLTRRTSAPNIQTGIRTGV